MLVFYNQNIHKRCGFIGDFDPNNLIMWINKDYCKNGYAYLSPFNSKKASVILVVTDVNEKKLTIIGRPFGLRKYKLHHCGRIQAGS